ncbi:hypothetical protein DRW41_18625 [Neobacillus piezotolerans]|uniref:DUF1878 domain-containing protein n=1 Tax=Neobacillus piezotolerans TaxID=2259171 RepID=A0A3D8GLF0_9BACI|nr:DUF1878 family protein [Neobacillus piezotolerans]RDU35300.1 hypothetical protein DRW41_18625 [Neobacillus piezotolerans]
MDVREIAERLRTVEYHLRLMADALGGTEHQFTKLVVQNNLSEKETESFFSLCEEMNKRMEEQKAEGFLNFHPLFNEFSSLLTSKLNPRDAVYACINEKVYLSLMLEFKKFV